MDRCEGKNKKGKQCGSDPLPGSKYCNDHRNQESSEEVQTIEETEHLVSSPSLPENLPVAQTKDFLKYFTSINLTTISSWGSFLSGLGALITLIFVTIQTCDLKEGVRLNIQQVEISNKQIELQLTATRPFIRIQPNYRPANKERTNFHISYSIINDSDIPGRVLVSNGKMNLSGYEIANPTTYDKETPRVIHRGMLQGFILIDISLNLKDINKIKNEESYISMASCIIYESLSKSDKRRWRAISKNIYAGEGFKTYAFIDEEVSSEDLECEVELPL